MQGNHDRPAPRINIRLSASLLFDGIPRPTRAVSVNLSRTGVLFQASRQVERGTKCHLEFNEFSAKGEVIWTRGVDAGVLLGVKFLSMRRRDRKALDEILRTGDHG